MANVQGAERKLQIMLWMKITSAPLGNRFRERRQKVPLLLL
jgi:hypothetical protein